MTEENSSSTQTPHPHPPGPRRMRVAGGRLEKRGRWVLGGTRDPMDDLTEQERQIYIDRLREAIESARRNKR